MDTVDMDILKRRTRKKRKASIKSIGEKAGFLMENEQENFLLTKYTLLFMIYIYYIS